MKNQYRLAKSLLVMFLLVLLSTPFFAKSAEAAFVQPPQVPKSRLLVSWSQQDNIYWPKDEPTPTQHLHMCVENGQPDTLTIDSLAYHSDQDFVNIPFNPQDGFVLDSERVPLLFQNPVAALNGILLREPD